MTDQNFVIDVRDLLCDLYVNDVAIKRDLPCTFNFSGKVTFTFDDDVEEMYIMVRNKKEPGVKFKVPMAKLTGSEN